MNVLPGILHSETFTHKAVIPHDGLTRLLEKVYAAKGWDFRDYKRSTLSRRLSKLLHSSRVSSCKEYSRILDHDPSEYNRLFSAFTIKVSEFFREPEVFDVIEKVLRDEFSGAPAKAWCCGCAYGEEAYSLGILFSEQMSRKVLSESRIFATDIDCEALEQARRAVYREEAVQNVPRGLREKYLMPSDGLHRVGAGLRGTVRFGTLDIVQNHSIRGVNILLCRNLFIYFNKALQEKVFQKLDYALKEGGILVMGKAEVLPGPYADRYTPVVRGLNVYRKNR
ncbi:MAG TPA: hypothetical protein DDW94_05800 [Deltaproteobacteria bacterium]|nr:MAG: hypothetical protein A2Z79_04150 [Deltaproteobacteria bacterium GWA2_55_82]OGQ64120.1 MAG: hypothetical protein A3I81_10530 [Deltaproteobacteria bacterium RIFCSPLOWO2_02_FULL_55_12]OIJ74572.1 MAG: hypothetical protein A2V21_310055 [Deltaproteobacteria bacterium GWC2_55_46]HBG46488.1 hypothetical protein [Deltaproteobacteria bacterium]HCY10700.1 hypothetical protein [Deltaproteobacteria bacterium]